MAHNAWKSSGTTFAVYAAAASRKQHLDEMKRNGVVKFYWTEPKILLTAAFNETKRGCKVLLDRGRNFADCRVFRFLCFANHRLRMQMRPQLFSSFFSLTHLCSILGDFTECNFTKCKFSEYYFTECNITDCNFTKCNITNCNLTKCNITDCNFTKSNFTKSNFTESNFTMCNITKCIFTECNFTYLVQSSLSPTVTTYDVQISPSTNISSSKW
jgi:uncharacterized protein YjbI with pentapeptide repeats